MVERGLVRNGLLMLALLTLVAKRSYPGGADNNGQFLSSRPLAKHLLCAFFLPYVWVQFQEKSFRMRSLLNTSQTWISGQSITQPTNKHSYRSDEPRSHCSESKKINCNVKHLAECNLALHGHSDGSFESGNGHLLGQVELISV